jgi:hypothetical protein
MSGAARYLAFGLLAAAYWAICGFGMILLSASYGDCWSADRLPFQVRSCVENRQNALLVIFVIARAVYTAAVWAFASTRRPRLQTT